MSYFRTNPVWKTLALVRRRGTPGLGCAKPEERLQLSPALGETIGRSRNESYQYPEVPFCCSRCLTQVEVTQFEMVAAIL